MPRSIRPTLSRWSGALVAVAGAALAAGMTAPAAAAGGPWWELRPTGSDSHFRGLSAVNRDVAWLGGYDGVILKTTNGGASWRDVSPAGAGALQFRDVEAFGPQHAVAMAAGEGADSRLYVTTNGGSSWRLAYTNRHPSAFFDCMSFFDARHGLTLSDPVDGKFRILATEDGGEHWNVRSPAAMPAAVTGEFAFAASGTCLTTRGDGNAWFGTGGAAARVFRSTDGGRTWAVSATPVPPGDSAGVFALAFRDRLHGVAVGGDYAAPDTAPKAVALTGDGGRTWRSAPTGALPQGYRSGVAFVRGTGNGTGTGGNTVVAVGLTGSDLSTDGGRTWVRIARGEFDGVDCASDGSCWASGDKGRVARLHRP